MSVLLKAAAGALGSPPPTTLWKIIQNAGINSSCVLCLDASDSSSYSGSGQVWTDRSGTLNFNRGTTSGSESSDPTFNGTAGSNSANEYFSSDSTPDLFTAASNPTFWQNIHKDNTNFSIIAVYYWSGATTRIIDTTGNDSSHGMFIDMATSKINYSSIRFYGTSESGFATMGDDGSIYNLPNIGSWNFAGVSFQEGVTNGTYTRLNQYSKAYTVTLTSPGTTNGATPALRMQNSDRYAMIAAFNTALTSSQIDGLYSSIKSMRPGYSLA